MTGRSWTNWIWTPQDERSKPIPIAVILFNWSLAFLLLALLCFFSFTQLRYNWNWDTVGNYSNFFWRGWLNTLKISSVALILSTVIGFLAALARRSGVLVLRALSRLYVELVRGTPLLVQISFAFYVVADAFHIQNRFAVGLFTLSLFSGAFISEIIRGGIESVGGEKKVPVRA